MRTIFLIKVSGKDQPGITSTITELLSGHNVDVLDIGQAVIHKKLALGLLVELPDANEEEGIALTLTSALQQKGLIVEFEKISLEDYEQWVENHGKPRHIVTLLARKITAGHINSVTNLIAKHALNIDKITRLSGRVPSGEINETTNSKACVEFSMRGFLPDEKVVRNELLELSNTLNIDIAYQEDDMFRRNRRLVVFDMDSTLIDAEVIDELAVEANVGEQVAAITESAMRGEIDFNESFKRRVALLKGLDESALEAVESRLQLTEGAEVLVKTLNRLGYKTAILSGGFTYFANKLKEKLGFDYVYANELDIQDSKVTGEVTGQIVNGERKAALLKEIADKEHIALEQVIAVGDGANDLPMLSIAGLGVAFQAKPVVKESARQSISNLGLDAILYLLGISDRELNS